MKSEMEASPGRWTWGVLISGAVPPPMMFHSPGGGGGGGGGGVALGL